MRMVSIEWLLLIVWDAFLAVSTIAGGIELLTGTIELPLGFRDECLQRCAE